MSNVGKKRSVEDTFRDEKQVMYDLEDLDYDFHRLELFENDVLGNQEDGLYHLRVAMECDYTSSRRNAAFYDEMMFRLETRRREIQENLELDYQELRKHKRQLEDKLDELYYERQGLYREEEERQFKEKKKI